MSYPNNGNSSGAIPVYPGASPAASSGAFVTGQHAVTASEALLPAQATNVGVRFTALATNTGNIGIGPVGSTLSTSYLLTPGATSPDIPCTNLDQVSVVGTHAGDTIVWIGQ